jgi:CheY-like chemotaxis protein
VPPPTVLVVDDSELILETLPKVLGQAFVVKTCSNPMLIASLLRAQTFNILLLDVDMPAISGPQVVQALRRSDCLLETKVVLYSARKGPALQELSKACGATAAVSKDVTGSDLVHTLEGILEEANAPKTSTASFLRSFRALVFANPPLEGRITRLLSDLGVVSQSRGVLGIDRVLREVDAKLVILEAAAFDDLPRILARLRARGVAQDRALLIVGECPGEECLSLSDVESGLESRVLKARVRAALKRSTGTPNQ